MTWMMKAVVRGSVDGECRNKGMNKGRNNQTVVSDNE
jgi:hypothetical protein